MPYEHNPPWMRWHKSSRLYQSAPIQATRGRQCSWNIHAISGRIYGPKGLDTGIGQDRNTAGCPTSRAHTNNPVHQLARLGLIQFFSRWGWAICLRWDYFSWPSPASPIITPHSLRGCQDETANPREGMVPGIDKMVERTVHACISCQASTPMPTWYVPLCLTSLTPATWTVIALHFLEHFSLGEYILVATDIYSCFFWCFQYQQK